MMSSSAKRRRCSRVKVSRKKRNECYSSLGVADTSEDNFCCTIFVKHLDRKAKQEEVKLFFEKFGQVRNMYKIKKNQTTAFVTFANYNEASKACQATSDDLMFYGKKVLVEKCSRDVRELKIKSSLRQLNDGRNSGFVAFFDLLPDEVLARIFSYLSIREKNGVTAVCKRWHLLGRSILCSTTKLVLDPTSPETFKQNPRLRDRDLVEILSHCGRNLKHLTLAKYNGLTNKAVGIIGKYCTNLVQLKLCRLSLHSAYLQKLAKGCPHLKSIIIQEPKMLRDYTLSKFLKQFSNLECFYLLKEGSSSFKKGKFCLGLSKNLQILRAVQCRYLYPPVVLASVMNQCDSLQEFCMDFAWGNVYFRPPRLNSVSLDLAYQPGEGLLVDFFHHFKNTLKVVHLYGIRGLDGLDWRRPICILERLEELRLVCCHHVDARFLKCLAHRCVKLKILNITRTYYINDECLVNLASLPCLSVLDVSCSDIDGSGLEVLAARGRLEEVYVRRCVRLKEKSCCILAQSCPYLRLLDATGVKAVTKTLVNTFWQYIKTGFLLGPVQLVVTDTSVVYAKYNCKGLEILFNNTLKCYGEPQ